VKTNRRLGRNHDILIPSKCRSRRTRARSNQTADERSLAATRQSANQSTGTTTAADEARRTFPLARLFLLILRNTYWRSGDRGYLDTQSA
jgi:hypothetical protein